VLSLARERALTDLKIRTLATLTPEQAALRRDVCEEAMAFLGKL
jgi:hypothetical protein